MKTLKTITLLCLLVTSTTQAQFLKKLAEKAEGKTERKATNLPTEYSFDWKYTLKMESESTKKRDMNMEFNYYINPNSTAFASRFEFKDMPTEMGTMTMIIDSSTDLNIMLTEIGEHKIKKRMPSYNDDENTEEQSEVEYTIVKTDTKTILGYQCQGFKITTQEAIMHMYFAIDAPVSFNQAFAGNSKMKPKGFKTEWLQGFENGLMMEMRYINKKKKKHNIKITCIGLVEEQLTIDTNDYKSF